MSVAPAPLVSIIIPVYKVEKYLDECLQSVCSQTYTNLEIILVDDGSPDQCGEMCDNYAMADTRVKVIHNQNAGVAVARNTGLLHATGEYIYFVDSDDYIAEDAIELALSAALNYDAEMVCSADCHVDESGNLISPIIELSGESVCFPTEAAMRYYAPKEWAPWNRLIKAEIHSGITFPNYKIHEDEAIKFRLLERCRRIVELKSVTYMYRQRTNSITSSDNTNRMDMFYSRYENLVFLKENHPSLCPFFIRNVCDAALLNLARVHSLPITQVQAKYVSDILLFLKQYLYLILCSRKCLPQQKLRVLIALCSNWEKETCLYDIFYAFIDTLKGRR